ncbi:MAG: RDD family protein [Acidobacteria bacterium]|nr:RDD family protein [Acidobacteriota bacterium]
MPDSFTPSSHTVANRPPYAGLGIRFLALLVDFLLFCALFFPVTRLVKGVWLMSATHHHWQSGLFVTDPLCLGFLAVMAGYFVVLEGLTGATLGKWLMGLRVVRVGGGTPGFLKGLVRNILRVVDGLPTLNILGVILIVTSPERARCGDLVAGTRVIHER